MTVSEDRWYVKDGKKVLAGPFDSEDKAIAWAARECAKHMLPGDSADEAPVDGMSVVSTRH